MKTSYIILIVVIAVIGGVVLSTYSDASSYATFNEAAATPDKEFHVVGTLVKEKPMEYDALKDANHFAFYLEDEGGMVRKVIYNQPKPNDFELSEKVVVVGKVTDEETFKASQILLKCPSKYEAEVASN
jgi:cytochrome c-type biogenesis protein CcmE